MYKHYKLDTGLVAILVTGMLGVALLFTGIYFSNINENKYKGGWSITDENNTMNTYRVFTIHENNFSRRELYIKVGTFLDNDNYISNDGKSIYHINYETKTLKITDNK